MTSNAVLLLRSRNENLTRDIAECHQALPAALVRLDAVVRTALAAFSVAVVQPVGHFVN